MRQLLGPETCDVCHKDFIRLKTHMKTHRERPPKENVTCTYPGCDNTFKTKSQLLIHTRIHHTRDKPFKCSYENCDQQFATANMRLSHFRTHIPPEQYDFPCEYEGCDRIFKRRTCLTEHMRTHSHTRYPCPIPGCNATYSAPCSVRTHVRQKHPPPVV